MTVDEVIELLFQLWLMVAEEEDYHFAVYAAEVVYERLGLLVGELDKREILLRDGEAPLVTCNVYITFKTAVSIAAVVLHGDVEDKDAFIVALSCALFLIELYELFIVPAVCGVAAQRGGGGEAVTPQGAVEAEEAVDLHAVPAG